MNSFPLQFDMENDDEETSDSYFCLWGDTGVEVGVGASRCPRLQYCTEPLPVSLGHSPHAPGHWCTDDAPISGPAKALSVAFDRTNFTYTATGLSDEGNVFVDGQPLCNGETVHMKPRSRLQMGGVDVRIIFPSSAMGQIREPVQILSCSSCNQHVSVPSSFVPASRYYCSACGECVSCSTLRCDGWLYVLHNDKDKDCFCPNCDDL